MLVKNYSRPVKENIWAGYSVFEFALNVLTLLHTLCLCEICVFMFCVAFGSLCFSTHVQLSCDKCDKLIGMMYKTTPRCFDDVRDLYFISINAVDRYELEYCNFSFTAYRVRFYTIPLDR